MYFLLDVAAIFVGIGFLSVVLKYRTVLSLPFPDMQAFKESPQGTFTRGYEALFESLESEFFSHSFRKEGWIKLDYSPDFSTNSYRQLIYCNPDSGTIIAVSEPFYIFNTEQLTYFLFSKLKDGRYAVTQVSNPYFVALADSETPAQNKNKSKFEDLLESHEEFTESLGAPVAKDSASIDSALDFFGPWQMNIRERLLARGKIQSSDGVYRPTIKFAHEILRVYKANPPPKTGSESVGWERLTAVTDHAQKSRHLKPSNFHERAIFILSMLASIAVGAPILGWQLTLIIILVIGFHEYGHLLAMKLFGYQNPHITFLPLLGGVTMGHETDPDPIKRAWVSLAGPLPGILLAWATIAIWYFIYKFPVNDFIIMLLSILIVINYLNLLPVQPLDGGQLIKTLIPNHYGGINVAILVSSVIIGVAAGIYLEIWLLVIIAATQVIHLPNIMSLSNGLKALSRDQVEAYKTKQQKTEFILQSLEKTHGLSNNPNKRILLAEEIENILTLKKMSKLHKAFVVLVYVSMFAALAGFFVTLEMKLGVSIIDILGES